MTTYIMSPAKAKVHDVYHKHEAEMTQEYHNTFLVPMVLYLYNMKRYKIYTSHWGTLNQQWTSQGMQ